MLSCSIRSAKGAFVMSSFEGCPVGNGPGPRPTPSTSTRPRRVASGHRAVWVTFRSLLAQLAGVLRVLIRSHQTRCLPTFAMRAGKPARPRCRRTTRHGAEAPGGDPVLRVCCRRSHAGAASPAERVAHTLALEGQTSAHRGLGRCVRDTEEHVGCSWSAFGHAVEERQTRLLRGLVGGFLQRGVENRVELVNGELEPNRSLTEAVAEKHRDLPLLT